jgi:rare lipoprotein A
MAAAVSLAACGAQPTKVSSSSKPRSKEYFAESEYGVKASPRVSNLATNLPRGGGRDQVGRPYQVRGQWFHPKEDPNYSKVGMASWYGDAFHGRLTANGEIYDMTHLTAAHPTMPLPSYARVTNTENGSSVIVRVNDRGPFARGRIIDLSRRAAELLDYQGNGVAKVQVDYIGRAPLHGQDDAYLMASYVPGGNDGYPDSGTMIAMNGPTPQAPTSVASRIESSFTGTAAFGNPVLPASVIAPVRRPAEPVFGSLPSTAAPLAYADQRMGKASDAFRALISDAAAEDAVVAAWQRRNEASVGAVQGIHVAVGTYPSVDAAQSVVSALGASGDVRLVPTNGGMVGVVVVPDGSMDIDAILRTAWAAGAVDAMTVRD